MKPGEQGAVDLVIRPSLKLVRAGYTAVLCVFVLCVLAYTNWGTERVAAWVLILPALLFLWPASRHLRHRFTVMTVGAGKLRYETGILTRSKRVIQLAKIQDVRVVQRLSQRLLGTGDISIETAGETSLLVMQNVDRPDAVTDAVLHAANLDTPERRGDQDEV
jgi:uncharacterized membrane protein YdbT with pleckstrin-like domain